VASSESRRLRRRLPLLGDGDRRQQAVWLFTAPRNRPPATPADGPDPYGNPDPAWLRIDWRQHLRSVEVGGTRVNYCEIGSGAPIVFVHGLAGCWQNWLENIPHFAERGHRVIALDLPGFGHSPLPLWEISISNYGGLVDDFCEALNLRACALVGNSMGGFVSAEVAIREPEWVQRLVLVSAAGISHARMRSEPAEMAARMAITAAPLAFRFRDRSLRRPNLRRLMFRNIFDAPERLPPELLWEFFHHAMRAPGFLPAVQGLVGYDFLDRLERVQIPTLIVWGRDDRVVPADDADGYARRLRNSRVVIFDRCGHCPMAERPARFNRLLEQFLAE
jgi:pimeloyl-ACP methyl ester carboxylesterase